MSKMKVYVAGKLNDDAVGYNKNRAKMMKLALEAHKEGYSVFVPCLIEQIGLLDGNWEYSDYFNNSMPWLLSSDAVLLVDNYKESKGTAVEIKEAMINDIPIFTSLDALNKYRDNKKDSYVMGVTIDNGLVTEVIYL